MAAIDEEKPSNPAFNGAARGAWDHGPAKGVQYEIGVRAALTILPQF